MGKINKCKLCGWVGRTHLHHIIPLRDYGEDTNKNIIELCPNHHAEACLDEYKFMKKYNLMGECFSDKKIDILKLASFLYSKKIFYKLDNKEQIFLNKVVDLYDFDKYDFIAMLMGTSRGTTEKKSF